MSREMVLNYIESLRSLFLQTKVTDKNNFEFDSADGIIKAAEIILKADQENRKKVIFVGNGGSAAVASHKALDFWFTGKIRGINFSDSSLLTCVSNDFGYEQVFAKPITMFADAGDVLVAISSSGKSKNILEAVLEAKKVGCFVITFSGFNEDNPLRQLGDLNFYVASQHFNKVESSHLLLCDCILELIVLFKNQFGDLRQSKPTVTAASAAELAQTIYQDQKSRPKEE